MKTFLLIAVAFLFGCQSDSKPENEEADSSKDIRQPVVAPTVKKAEQADASLENKILGVWDDGNSVNATFRIDSDSIFYVEQLENYKYTLQGDSIKIFYPDFTYSGKLSFIKDTLVMTSPESEPAKFWRFKN